MKLVITEIKPEYREIRTKFGQDWALEQYRLDYVLHIPGKTEIVGQHVQDDTGPLDLDQVKAVIIDNLKKAFAQ